MAHKSSRRYATAIYEVAKEKGDLDNVTNDVTAILNLINSNKEFELFFASPVISKAKKLAVVKEVLGPQTSELILSFINLLIARRREFLTKGVLEDFIKLKKEKDGIVDVQVKTSVELSDEEKLRMKQKIDTFTKLKSDLSFEIDKNIVGGFVAKINDTILDASIKRQLEILRKKFKEGDFVLN